MEALGEGSTKEAFVKRTRGWPRRISPRDLLRECSALEALEGENGTMEALTGGTEKRLGSALEDAVRSCPIRMANVDDSSHWRFPQGESHQHPERFSLKTFQVPLNKNSFGKF